jgi:hypothetical protein
MATLYKGILLPNTAQSTAITTSTATQVLDPADAFEIVITSSADADVASLPGPVAGHVRNTESDGTDSPKVVVGQLLLITHGTDGGGSITISYNNISGTAKTAASIDANDTLLLVAGSSGYAILENTGFTIA